MSEEKNVFARIYERQVEFNRRFFADRGYVLGELSTVDRVRWSKEWVLHVEGELHELLRETNWKMHRVSLDPVVRGNVLEEWTDAFKFLLGLASVWGFSAADLEEEFYRKSRVVEYRYGMEQRLRSISSRDRVIGVDIDGVLNDYPKCFLDWVRGRGESSVESLSDLREAVGLETYRGLKDAYRSSGAKQKQGVRPGAKELIDGIRSVGGTIVALSKRPYWRYSRIYADTLRWMEANMLVADAILFHKEKHRKILKDFPEMKLMIEDDPAIVRELVTAGVAVIYVRNELNAGVSIPGARSVDNLADALTEVRSVMKKEIKWDE